VENAVKEGITLFTNQPVSNHDDLMKVVEGLLGEAARDKDWR
jgi:hypothetical protein